MARSLFTDDAPWSGTSQAEVPPQIVGAIDELASVRGVGVTGVYRRGEQVGVSLTLDVDLPSRGPAGGVDVRSPEPVLLVFDAEYPAVPPEACSNRKDFPAEDLPHLNSRAPGAPPSLCLYRGDIDSWFAEHSLADLVELVRRWLSDAAAGLLMREGDGFEHARVASATNVLVCSDSVFADVIADAPGPRFFVARILRSPREQAGISVHFAYELERVFEAKDLAKVVEELKRYNDKHEDRNDFLKTCGIVLPPTTTTVDTYFSSIPQRFDQLASTAKKLGVSDLASVVAMLAAGNGVLRRGLPVVMVIRRPRPMMHSSSSLEAVGFSVLCDWERGRMAPAAKVWQLSLRARLSTDLARRMSGTAVNLTPAVFGCGALGSKIALHLARAGCPPGLLVDPAVLLPHNLARHALLAGSLAEHKAVALKVEMAQLLGTAVELLATEALPRKAHRVLEHHREVLAKCDIIVDATASSAVLSQLATSALPANCRVVRSEIADGGRLGIVMREGAHRNPRIDDVQAALFDLARTDDDVETWLRNSRKRHAEDHGELDDVQLGIGCASQTLVLDDARVSLFAAATAAPLLRGLSAAGEIQLTIVGEEPFSVGSRLVAVPSVTTIENRGPTNWKVRVSQHALTKIAEARASAGDSETGGVLVGFFHDKRRTLYVTDALPASSDSRGTPAEFVRGVDGYGSALDVVHRRTGLLGYAGEWHTHPASKALPSATDLAAAEAIKRDLRGSSLPTHILIHGTDGPRSFIYADH